MSLHTELLIDDYFEIESGIVSTRTADLYKATDKSRGVHVSLWVLKQPFEINSKAVKMFLQRLTALQNIEAFSGSILSFGVDAAGVGFSVFSNITGFPVMAGNKDAAEVERRFIAALRFVEKIHTASQVCGDICDNSFWIERTGDLRMIGVMGAFDSMVIGQPVIPPVDSIPYMSPEQLSGEEPGQRADVFAIGVLGYKLYSGKFPFTADANGNVNYDYVPLNAGNIWANQVFSKCLNPDPAERYSSAKAVISAIIRMREDTAASEASPTKLTSSGGKTQKPSSTMYKMPLSSSVAEQEDEEENEPIKKNIMFKSLLVVGVVSVISFFIFKEVLGFFFKESSSIESALEMHTDALKDQQIKLKFDEATSQDSEKEAYYKKIVQSDDPIYHDVLIKAARDADTDKDRMLAETAILDRARRLGLRRSAEVVRPWLRSHKTGQLPASYESVLRAVDPTLPPEARDAAMRASYQQNQRVILRLAAALALDTGNFAEYQKALADFAGQLGQGSDFKDRSALSIILYSTELVSVFGDDVIQKRQEIPDADIEWLLDALAERNDMNVRVIASLALDKNLLSPIKKFYLSPIRDKEDLPIDILNTLVKAASNNLKPQDIANFGNWLDKLADEVLLAICADTFSIEVKKEAFDVLAGKTLSKQPAGNLIQWVRKNQWDNRDKFIDAVGQLSNIELFGIDKAIEAMQVFDPFIKDPQILSAFLDSTEPLIVRTALKRYPNKIGLGRRLMLLQNSDKETRILAIKSLTGFNDVAGLKIIIDAYNQEKDEEVKNAYKEEFWVIREKQSGSF